MNCPTCGHDFWDHYADGCDLTSCECTTSEQGFFAAAWDAGHAEGRKDGAAAYARAANGLDPLPDTPNPYRESEPA